MEFLLTAIAFLIIFSALVLIHEWGHFYAARKAGVEVQEFGFGLPPRIWGKKYGETLYSINWIPFGGFVKLLGEDAHDPKALKNKRSFAAKRPRTRLFIIVAGVLMNFLLAWVLLTIGFTFGIQPLIVGPEDVLAGLKDGSIQTTHGIVVKEVEEGITSIQPGDRLLTMNGHEIFSLDQLEQTDWATFDVEHEDGGIPSVSIDPAKFETYDVLFLPRIIVSDVKPGSATAEAGLQSGDVILEMNNEPIYFMEDYDEALRSDDGITYMVLRDNEVMNFEVEGLEQGTVIISSVFDDSPAREAGVQKGDLVLTVNGETVGTPQELIEQTQSRLGEEVLYQLQRNGEVLELAVQPDEHGLIGVGISDVRSYDRNELSVYAGDAPASVLKIEDVRYPFWIAPVKALEETGRLSTLTLDMFGNVVRQLTTQFTVPEGVAGPVGIAQLTHVFVQEGILSLLRFMALLSLSLAIINILPFPALDGGRAFFILMEVLLGKRLGGRFEALIHAAGFLLLMLLIFAITYSDILRLF